NEATSLMDQAVAWFQSRLPDGWKVTVSELGDQQQSLSADARLTLQAPNGAISTIVVEEKKSLSPREVLEQISPRVMSARKMGAHLPLLVIAPWISERTQTLLAETEVNYLDITGNALFRTDNP